jgi:hypothetical protein
VNLTYEDTVGHALVPETFKEMVNFYTDSPPSSDDIAALFERWDPEATGQITITTMVRKSGSEVEAECGQNHSVIGGLVLR